MTDIRIIPGIGAINVTGSANFRGASNSSVLFITGSGGVGVGTTVPDSEFHIRGSQTRFITLDRAGTHSYDIGINSTKTFLITDNVAEADRIALTLSGSVGIGVTNPGARLEIRSVGSEAGGAEIRLQHANNNSTDVVSTVNFANNVGSVAMIQAGTTSGNTNGYISFFTDNAGSSSEKMRIISDGNVGIGTSAPVAKLVVAGTAYINQTSDYFGASNTKVQISAGSSSDNIGIRSDKLYLYSYGNGTDSQLIFGDGNAHWGLFANDSRFALYNHATSATSIHVSNTGNVGIGTTSPDERLHVSGNIKIEQSGNTNAQLILNPYSSALGSTYQWELIGADSTNNYNLQIRENGTPYVTIRNSVSGNAGYVGINNVTPAYRLDVNGNASVAARFQSTADAQIQLLSTNTWAGIQFTDSSDSDYIWYRGATETFAIGGGGSTVAGKKLHIHGGATVGSGYASYEMPTNGLSVEGGVEIGGDLTVDGRITAQEFHTSFVSASIIYESGSTKFGNSQDDNHAFTGSLDVSGSVRASVHGNGNYIELGLSDIYPAIKTNGSVIRVLDRMELWGRSGARYLDVRDDSTNVNVFLNGIGNSYLAATNGNVGVGTTSPAAKFEVYDGNNSIKIGDVFGSSTAGIELSDGQTGYGIVGWGASLRLMTNSNPSLTINSSGNIGIGTTSPNVKLEIKGATSENTQLRLQTAGDASEIPSILFRRNSVAYGEIKYNPGGGGDQGIHITDYRKDASNIIFNTSGSVERMRITKDGNVGIGTTAPSNKVTIYGSGGALMKIHSSNSEADIFYESDAPGGTTWQAGTGYSGAPGGISSFFFYREANKFAIHSDGQLSAPGYGQGNFTAASVYRLAVDANGNIIEESLGDGSINGLGASRYIARWADTDSLTTSSIYEDTNGDIGIGTTTLGAQLHVKKGGTGIIARLEGGTGRYLYTGTDALGQYMEIVGTQASERVLRIQASDGSSNYTQLFIDGANQYIYTDSGTDVGIGYSTPDAKLVVSDGTNRNLRIGQLAHQTVSGMGVGLTFSRNSSDAPLMAIGVVDDDELALMSRVSLRFLTGGTNNYQYTTERMRIDDNGDVLIGSTTSTSDKLQVTGENNKYTARINGGLGGSQSYGLRVRAGTSNVDASVLVENTGGVDLFAIKGDGNVGVGLYSPAAKLHVSSSSGTALRIETEAIGQGAPQLYIEGNKGGSPNALATLVEIKSNTDYRGKGIIFSNADDTKEWFTGVPYTGGKYVIGFDSTNDIPYYQASASLVILENGNVGVGTTNPQGSLHVYTGTSERLLVSGDVHVNGATDLNINGSSRRLSFTSGTGTIRTTTSNKLFLETNTTTALTIDTNQNVGIGTSSPDTKLHVEGGVGIFNVSNAWQQGNSGTHLFRAGNFSSSIDENATTLKLYPASNSDRAVGKYWGGIAFMHLNPEYSTWGTSFPGDHFWIGGRIIDQPAQERSALVFATNSSTTGGSHSSEKMVILPDGKVGIGTTSPGYKLEVNGSVGIGGDLEFTVADGINIKAKESMIFTIDSDDNDTSRVFQFKDGGGDILTTITDAGNVGIGTTVPSNTLHVENSGNGSVVRVTNSQNSFYLGNDSNGGYLQPASTGMAIYGPSGANYVYVNNTGVGINQTSPREKLEVNGQALLNSALFQRSQTDHTDISAGNEYINHTGPIRIEGSGANIAYYGTFKGYQAVYGSGSHGWDAYTQGAYARPILEFYSGNNGTHNFPAGSALSTGFLYQFVKGPDWNGTGAGTPITSSNSELIWGITNTKYGYFANRLGVATTSPDTAFSVADKFEINDDGVASWGGAGDYGRLTWDTGKAIITGLSSKALSFGSNATYDRMVLDTSGNLIIGGSSAPSTTWTAIGKLAVVSDTYVGANFTTANNTNGNYTILGLGKSRGTIASPTAVANGETVSRIVFYGHDGTDYRFRSGISSIVNGTVSSGVVPLDMTFETGTSGATERMRITSGGNVGIGTTNPSDKLTIVGSINMPNANNWSYIKNSPALGGVRIATGNASGTLTNGLSVSSGGNYVQAHHPLKALDGFTVTGNTEMNGDLTVDGIITAREFHTEFVNASIIYESGSTKFGNSTDDNHAFTGSINLLAQSGAEGLKIVRGGNLYMSMNSDSSRQIFKYGTNLDFRNINNTSIMYLSGSGNVGINKNTPEYTLDVGGYARIQNWLRIDKTGAATTSQEGGLSWNYNGSPQYYFYTDNANNGDLRLQAAGLSGESDNLPRIVIPRTNKNLYFGLSGGNVGIGLQSATATLDVHGNARFGPDSEHALQVTEDSGNNFMVVSTTQRATNSAARDIKFRSYGTDATDNVLVMDMSGGSVGIGLAAPSKPLHVYSSNDAPIRVESSDSTTGILFADPDNNNALYYVGSGNYFYTTSELRANTLKATDSDTAGVFQLAYADQHKKEWTTSLSFSFTAAGTYNFNLVFRNSGGYHYDLVATTDRNGTYRNFGTLKDSSHIYWESDGDFAHRAEGDVHLISNYGDGMYFSADTTSFLSDSKTGTSQNGSSTWSYYIVRYSIYLPYDVGAATGVWKLHLTTYGDTGGSNPEFVLA